MQSITPRRGQLAADSTKEGLSVPLFGLETGSPSLHVKKLASTNLLVVIPMQETVLHLDGPLSRTRPCVFKSHRFFFFYCCCSSHIRAAF